MAGFFTDADDKKAVEELLSQAMDMVALEQLTAINSSAFKTSSLPSHLETRFQNLKANRASSPSSSQKKSLDPPRSTNLKKSNPAKVTKNPNPIDRKNAAEVRIRREKLEQFKKKMLMTCSIKWPKQTRVGFTSNLSPPAKTGCFFMCSFSK